MQCQTKITILQAQDKTTADKLTFAYRSRHSKRTVSCRQPNMSTSAAPGSGQQLLAVANWV